MSTRAGELADALERGTLDPASFGHAEHVAAAFELLGRYPFLHAVTKYADGVRALTAMAGAPDKFNLTMTLGFMSLIAERRAAAEYATFEAFARGNADLLSANTLRPWYTAERLRSAAARETFLMPDRVERPT